MKKYLLSFVAFAMVLGLAVTPALAATNTTNFEAPTYSTGPINNQDGWSMTGPYDAEVVSNSYGYANFGDQSLRISNAVTSGSFGDWVFSKSLNDEAGETLAQNNGLSGGDRQEYFEASWDFASTVPNAEQPGLQVSTAPDRGDGARMSFVKMYDTPTGLSVDFAEYQSGLNGVGCQSSNFVTTTVATSLNRASSHSIKLTMQFVDGPNNDIVKVYVDGNLVRTGTSWEGYFNECESSPTRTVDSMIFQARSGAGTAPATNGFGFVIDNLNLTSSEVPPVTVGPPTNKDQCKNDGWKIFNSPSFKNQGQCVSYVEKSPKAQGPKSMVSVLLNRL